MRDDQGANSFQLAAGAGLAAGGSVQAPGGLIRRAPLVPAAAAMVAGVLAGRYAPAPIGVWAATGAAAVVLGGVSLAWRHLRKLSAAAIAAGIVCISAAAAARAYHRIPADHVVTYSDLGPVPATIRGRIVSEANIRALRRTPWRRPRTAFLLEADSIRRADEGWIKVAGLARVTVGEPHRDLTAGDEVELVGTLSRPRPPGNPGQYDRRKADRYKGIHARFFVPGADGVERLRPGGGNPGRRLLEKLRATARQHLRGLGSEQESVLVEALVLGRRGPELETLNRTMMDAGVAHFLSISGLHLGIFLGFVYWLCRLLALPKRRAAAVVLLVLIAYVLLAEPRTPLLRGAIMAAALCLAVISGRALSVVNALAAAAVILLVADPLQLFRPGFQLSFCIVGGIVVLRKPIAYLLFGRWLRRRGLMVFRSDERVRRWLTFRAADWLIALVSMSLAAYLAAAPLVAYHFGIFSPYAPLLSILLLPVTAMVLIPAYLSTALSWLLPNAAAGLGELAAAAAGLMQGIVMLLRRLPGLSFDAFAVPVWFVVLYYAALGLWALVRRYRRALAPARAASAAVLAAILWTQLPAPAPSGGRLHVLDVGHGAMVLLHAPDGSTHLFDAGTLGPVSAYHQVLRPFLRAKRLPPPQTIFISHANADHYNAVGELLARAPPGRVYLNEFFGNAVEDRPEVRQLIRKFQDKGVQVVRLRARQSIPLAHRARVDVLWPPPAEQAPDLDVNDTSLVLRLVVGGRSVLLPGDVGEKVEDQLAGLPAGKLHSDVLVLPHHGSYTPTLQALLDAVGAELLVQSSSYRPETQELLQAIAGRKRLATYRHGWIQIDLNDDGVSAKTMRQ